jgi:hypothetical protein
MHIAGVCCQLDFSSEACHVSMFACDCVARVGSLHRVRDGNIILIGKMDARWPEAFYPVSSVDIQSGDYVVGQCVFDNNETRAIEFG